VAAAVALGCVAVTGCSSAGGTPAPTSASPSDLTFDGVSVKAGSLGTVPTFLIGDSTQQTSSLQIKDVIEGDGPVAGPTDKATVQYVARSAKTKRQVDSSWDRGQAFSYDPAQITFKAFSEGVPGMRVGGRRLVIVPGPLAFGANPPQGSGVGPDETLVFVIDLLAVNGNSGSASAPASASATSS
jgi:peptidylprolyl isomerase